MAAQNDSVALGYLPRAQVRYHMFARYIEKDVIAWCRDHGVGILAHSVLGKQTRAVLPALPSHVICCPHTIMQRMILQVIQTRMGRGLMAALPHRL